MKISQLDPLPGGECDELEPIDYGKAAATVPVLIIVVIVIIYGLWPLVPEVWR